MQNLKEFYFRNFPQAKLDLSDKLFVRIFILIVFFSLNAFPQECCKDCNQQERKNPFEFIWQWVGGFVDLNDEISLCGEKGPAPILPAEWPLELIPVKKIDYVKNEHASYCKRPPEIVDTIVIHHSETPSQDPPEEMNRIHLNNGSKDDPWYMIGYSYTINSPYPGEKLPLPLVAEGRPMDLVGAHAGTKIYIPMNELQQKLWEEGKVVCGRTGEEFKMNPKLIEGNKISANVTTIGVVVIGNYAPLSRDNPRGYPPGQSRKPTPSTLEMVAKLSCQLQKKYPNIKNIKWHSMYHSTTCPGDLKNSVPQIKAIAKGYGCEFK